MGRAELFLSLTTTFSATKPRIKRRRIRENSRFTPRSCKVATRRVFRKSGRPTRLHQPSRHSTASTVNQTAKRNQRNVVRHLRQNPGMKRTQKLGWKRAIIQG